jgi:hypothetical protein
VVVSKDIVNNYTVTEQLKYTSGNMSRIFVIAGTYQEATSWIAKNYQERVAIGDQQASTNDYKYVSHADDVKGYTNPHGVFVGNWLGRPDIFEIVEALMMRSTHVNHALGKIYSQVKPKVRPTPKIQGITISSVIVDEAAKLMARDIDEMVLKSLMKTNGTIA